MEKKESERQILKAARDICPLFPAGEIELFEKPDLLIKTDTGLVGIEVTELLRRPMGKSRKPVEDEDFHRKVVRRAEKNYYFAADAKPVCVSVAFLDEEQCRLRNPKGWHRLNDKKSGSKKDKMTKSLVEFVQRHYAAGTKTYSTQEMPGQMDGDTLPTGFEVIGIFRGLGPWNSGESAMLCPLNHEQLNFEIEKKNKLLPQYRHNPPDMPIWLLIYSGIPISRGVPIPPSVTEWKFAFDFEKVFLFSQMDNRVFEIGL